MYAVIKTGGKQYRVQQGDVIFVEKLNAQADEAVTFDRKAKKRMRHISRKKQRKPCRGNRKS